ncbi:MAG: DUF4390 domain-containing protein [Candidatus Nitrospinota bacterium M3_3B_026]
MWRFAACALLLFFVIPASSSEAVSGEAFVLDVVREPSPDRVYISASIKGAFTPEIVETIESGTPVTFTYFLQLKRRRPILWNETVRKLAIKRMVKFDTLKKEYLTWEKRAENAGEIDFGAEAAWLEYKNGGDKENPSPEDGEAKKAMDPVIIKDKAELRRWMARLEKIDLGQVREMSPGARYYARVRCEMKSIKLIPPFNYILFFLTLWDFDTEWGSSTTFTIEEAAPAGGAGGG